MFNSGPATISGSTLSGNIARAGGAIENVLNRSLAIKNSTVADNVVDEQGGGIANHGTMTITNTTISNNSARFFSGAGVFNSGTLTVTNSTISGNFTGREDGGGVANGGAIELQNTILALNSAQRLGPDCFGPISSLGNNIIGDTSDCDIALLQSDLTGDPGLDDFTDDGTPGNGNFPLLETSLAIDAGNNEVCLNDPVLATDQLGNPRIGVCDIGAIEFQPLLTIALDVKPHGAANRIAPKSHGIVRVAILSTSTFDATTIDQTGVRFGPNEASAQGKGDFNDLNADGQLDLVLRFRIQDSGIQCGDTSVSISGQTMNGRPIQGADTIQTVGCNVQTNTKKH